MNKANVSLIVEIGSLLCYIDCLLNFKLKEGIEPSFYRHEW
jgi:hypothetical protein